MTHLSQLDLLFPQEYLKATLLISLLTVWVLVGLFYYLNRYTKRDYFAIWTAGWLFYALWLTTTLSMGNAYMGSLLFVAKQCCVSLSATFLLWGSLRFLGLPVRQTLFGIFMVFLLIWILISPQVIKDALQVQMPLFILLGSSSLFAGTCFFRLRKRKSFVGAGMLSLGFLLWGFYLATYPLTQKFGNLSSAGFFVGAVLQLFIAVSMIVLVLEEVRDNMVQKERLHAIGQMAIGMAHEVNNALCPVTGYSEFLLRTLPNLDEASRDKLQKITEAADSVTQIVTRMRECYRRELDPENKEQAEAALSLPLTRVAPAAAAPVTAPAVPAPAPVAAPVATTPLAAATPTKRSLRILYIDDEPMLRQVMHDVLELQHHKVSVAASGSEGLEMFRANQGGAQPYELVITDFGMPDMDGRVVARTLRQESPSLPIVMLTGWGAMMNADGEKVPEVNAVIGKPPHIKEFNNLLLQLTSAAA